MNTSEPGECTVQWKKFWPRFIFWFLSIPVNIIPIFLKHFRNVTPDTFRIKNFLAAIVGDFDFSFISLSGVLMLCIEGFFAEGELARIYRKFQLGALIYGIASLFLYTCFFFKPEMFSAMGERGTFIYNLVLILLTVILGFLCNATISIEMEGGVRG